MGYILRLLPSLLSGAATALVLFFVVLLCSIPLGFLFTLCLRSRVGAVRAAANVYVYIFRSTPLMLQLIIIYFGLPYLPVVGEFLKLERFSAAILGFILNYAAYFAEIFRGGLLGVDRGQYEAAQVLGLTKTQTTVRIIIPQMVRIALPSVGNEIITLLKDTSLLYAVSVPEIIKNAQIAVNRDANFTALGLALVIYMALNFVLTVVIKKLEGLMKWGE